MKSVFFYLVLLFFTIVTYSQTGSLQYGSSHPPLIGTRWNLNEYVWSQTHPQLGDNEKPVLDFDAIDNWVSLSGQECCISPNGLYFVYGVQNNVKLKVDTVIVQSTVDNWRAVLAPDSQPGFFSSDSRKYIFQDNVGLCFLNTGTGERRYEKGVGMYKTDIKKEWLAYRLVNPQNTLVLLNLVTGDEKRINEVSSYTFDGAGAWLAYHLNNKQVVLRNLASGEEVKYEDVESYNFHLSGKWFDIQTNGSIRNLILFNLTRGNELKFSGVKSFHFIASGDYLLLNTDKGLEYVNLMEANSTTIWSNDTNTTINSLGFDRSGKQVVFMTEKDGKKAIWYWKIGMNRAEQEVSNQTSGFENNIAIQNQVDFTDNGHYLRFSIQPAIADLRKPVPGAIQLDVWSYQDRILQSAQPYTKEITTRSAILNLKTGQVILPEREHEMLNMVIGNYATIRKSGNVIYGDRFWEKGYYEDSIWLISFEKGSRKLLSVQRNDLPQCLALSPDGLYLVYFDAAKGCNYFSYELATGKLLNISTGVPKWQLGITRFNLRTAEKPASGSELQLWLEGNKGFLVYDNYGDFWQLDPTGKTPAKCITNGYGKLHNISFNILDIQGGNHSFIGIDTLLLSAFNRSSKLHGFFRAVCAAKSNSLLLSIDSCNMEGSRYGNYGQILKAENSDTWILKRQSATKAPNYYVTHDFKNFKQLTFLQPHKNYNWLTAELHSFKQLDGTISQGVLYKPENFNPAKKYPVIISFYGNLSDQLYEYPTADYITSNGVFSNPAWMVSHGYLVFVPDIYFIKNQWGPSTVNTIDGAAKYLEKLAYVDGAHMGAAGHSNSGRFGYYLLTHSKSFAAMSVGSGFTGADVLSGALSLEIGGKQTSNLQIAEVKAYGTALGNIWQNKARWIEHIAPLQADQATSPFLLFHNKKDGDDVRLAIELFIAFRRLEKKAWWLQYDNGYHTVGGDDARDWTIRYTQFFDHYLKGAPAPIWMTKGICAAMKGIQSGYDLDPAGTCAMKGKNACKVCNKWNEIFKKNPELFRN